MRLWNVAHAAAYGAVIGALAALFKALRPLAAGAGTEIFTAKLVEIATAALVFALLCAAAAILRNFIARCLVWDEK
jgi:hypothetical protein